MVVHANPRPTPTVFLSYARSASAAAAAAVHQRLAERDVDAFLDVADIEGADQISPAVVGAIRGARLVLALLSQFWAPKHYATA